MKWIKTQNNKVLDLNDIPLLDLRNLRQEIILESKEGKRVIGFFGAKEASLIRLYVILADDKNSCLLISSAIISKINSYPSITNEIPAFHAFEREFFEEFGVESSDHPWLKPVRYSQNRFDKTQKIENYPFFKMEGEDVHEVAVGPIHAGVIEPGHFRFMCNGENVYHLEIQLGYQHKNIEDLFLQKNKPLMHLAESIAGDTVIGHSIAYCNAVEALMNIQISERAELIRAVALEMERIAVHIGDLGAISNDIAYLMGNSIFGATRTLVINTLLEICGSRYGRGLVREGGVAFDIDENLSDRISKMLDTILKSVKIIGETLFSSSSVLSRLEKTGVLSKETALEIGLAGMSARASGISIDIRTNHPWGEYKNRNTEIITMKTGDVYARAYIRYMEIMQSAEIIRDLLKKLSVCKDNQLLSAFQHKLKSNSIVVSMTEGWRGEVVHTVLTDESGNISKYKIKDPSFNNWYGLALAVRDNGISNFPLINKSFNLSYCGNDL
ncbi:MAG TPA: NADH-quinone oxidoreductase subunit C [Candidatus Gastranaerophilales bacterium]|nr:NADH-quinone oxidoreductase subunit C [Candidatus Gastranaerophilales bacterium]